MKRECCVERKGDSMVKKKYKIDAVLYEKRCFPVIRDRYTSEEYQKHQPYIFAAAYFEGENPDIDLGFNPKDGCIYVNSIDELIPPALHSDDRKRFVAMVKKCMIKASDNYE